MSSMKRGKTKPQQPADDDIIIDGESFGDHAEYLHLINLNALMRNSGVLDDAQLAVWLQGANFHRHPDNFGSYEIMFGFDRHGQDFVVVKSKVKGKAHFTIIAEEGSTK